MKSTMMDYPLTLTHFLDRAERCFPSSEIVSYLPGTCADTPPHRYKYPDFARRAKALAAGLVRSGVKQGDRVGTLMWNQHAHLECYFAVPVIGAVLHTLNLRLHPDELAYIINHADDRIIIVDDCLLHLIDAVRPKINVDRLFVVQNTSTSMPADAEPYESLLTHGETTLPRLDENLPAAMCYTSGTTGKPKGVVYSHRSLVLHSMALVQPDNFNISKTDTTLAAMSMFHANAWGVPYAGTMVGARQVFAGNNLQPENLLNIMQNEQVTFTGAVPTVWSGVLDAMEAQPQRWQLASDIQVMVAGSAAPESIFRRFDRFGIKAVHLWGLTETSPLATACRLPRNSGALDTDTRYAVRASQGSASPLVDMRIVRDSVEQPWDGESVGEVQVRGPWVTDSYHGTDRSESQFTDDGWFRTGDVGAMTEDGYLHLTDRAKDLIKSGGEWISSIDLENALCAHPAVKQAAVVGIYHPKWQERPLALVILREGHSLTLEQTRDFLSTKAFAKWQLPDALEIVDVIPHSSTGKMQKSEIRGRYKDYFTKAETVKV
jgi:fatty-acyl-CoA synthase